MSEVKRYDHWICHADSDDPESWMGESQSGDWVKHVDYAALQQQLNAVVAENASMRSAIDQTIGWQESVDAENVESVRMLVDLKTPATDAILNAVRAEGIEILAEDLATTNPELADGTNKINKAVAWYARQFASKMRTADAAKDGDHE